MEAMDKSGYRVPVGIEYKQNQGPLSCTQAGHWQDSTASAEVPRHTERRVISSMDGDANTIDKLANDHSQVGRVAAYYGLGCTTGSEKSAL